MGAFKVFVADLTLTPAEVDAVGHRVRQIMHATEKAFSASGWPLVAVSLFGSVARATSIRPFEDFDTAVVVRGSPAQWRLFTPLSFLKMARDALQALPAEERAWHDIKIWRGEALTLTFASPPNADVFVGMTTGGRNEVAYWPHQGALWFRTNPLVLDQHILARNEETHGRLVPFLVLLKAWNRVHGSPLRSFHLETAASSRHPPLTGNYGRALWEYFARAVEEGTRFFATSSADGFIDDLSQGFDHSVRVAVDACMDSLPHATAALDAERNRDDEEACRLWRRVLGASFPTAASSPTSGDFAFLPRVG
jgi:hypothetical protein